MDRTQIAKWKNQNRKNASDDRPKLFINSKFCMIFMTLIPIMNYNAKPIFKRILVCRHTDTHEFQPMAKA
jgi:hypothetical protein